MLLAGLLLGTFAADSLRLQESKVDITPPEPLPLGGYTARGSKVSEPGGDRLYARVVILRRGTLKLAIVSCEMLTIPNSLHRAVEDRMPKDVSLFLAATHTHCAPDSQMLNDRMTFSIPGIASFKQRWLEWYADKIASAVREAEEAPQRRVGRLENVGYLEALNRGRREGAAPDKSVNVVEAERTPIFFSYAAHATFFGPERLQLSGDWAGSVAEKLNCPVLVGAIGDVSPHEKGRSPEEMIAAFTTKMADGYAEALERSTPVWKEGSAFRLDHETITLDRVQAQPAMGAYYKVPQPLAESVVRQFAPPAASVTAFRFGKLAVVGVPGEPTSHLGRAIKAYGLSLGFSAVLVISHVNGWMGYILDRADYDHGGYEATLSFYGRDEGAKVVEAADRALRELARR